MNHNAAKNILCEIFNLAFLDLQNSYGPIKDDAVFFFESGNYLVWSELIDIHPELLYSKYQQIIKENEE